MKTIAIEPLGDSSLVQTGTTLLAALLAKDLRVLMSCGGKGMCSTCHVRVCEGMEQLSPMGPKERRTLSLVADAVPESRLACQTMIYGDGVTVRVPEGMYIEKSEDLLSLLGTLARENILHPITGAVLIPRGKIITRTLLEQSRSVASDLRRVREQAAAESISSDSSKHAPFTASGINTRPSGTTRLVPRTVTETKHNTAAVPSAASDQTSSKPRKAQPSTSQPSRPPSTGEIPEAPRTNVVPILAVADGLQKPETGKIDSPAGPRTSVPAQLSHTAIHPGAQVDKYLLLERVGKGGSGVVYRALHTKLKTLVAIKFLHRNSGSIERSTLERFAREAQLLAQLAHPHVVRVLDFEDDPVCPYLVMEFVEGFTAAELIQQSGRVSPSRAAAIALDVADGLEAVRTIGMVHRDVKPGNILVTRNGGSKLLDLGLATFSQVESAGSSTRMASGAAEGTIGYMSPEAIGRASVDHRSDIYSLGATLFHLIAGRLPFQGDSLYELIFKHLEEPPPLLHEYVPEASPELSAIITRMMAKSPDARYQRYSDLRADLAAVAESRSEQFAIR